MLSYTALRNKFGVIVNSTNSTILANGDNWINDAHRILCDTSGIDFTEKSKTDLTVASQQSYQLPFDYEKLKSVTVTIGSFKYPVREVTSRAHWDKLQLMTSTTSSYPYSYFIDAGLIYFWPTPTTAGYTITFNYRKKVRDLSVADYTTGTLTLTNASTGVVGSSTAFTAAMVGRYLKSNTDGFWYEIASVTDGTNLVLVKKWQGTTAASLAHTIGEMPLIPEAFHPALVDYAVAEYWILNGEPARAVLYSKRWEDAKRKIIIDGGNKTDNWVVSSSNENINDDIMYPNPNLFVSL
jgi:hypothetical protein